MGTVVWSIDDLPSRTQRLAEALSLATYLGRFYGRYFTGRNPR